MGKKIFIENANIETQTSYFVNGDIKIDICPFEANQHDIVPGRCMVSQRGRMYTKTDGSSYFRSYNEGTGRRYEILFSTEHADLMKTQENVFVKFKIGKKANKLEVSEILRREVNDIIRFISSKRVETKW